MEFKDRLRYLRKNYNKDGQKLTQEKLGDVLGYKYTSVSNYESGRNEPCIRDLIKLADFFDVSLDYLVCSSEQRYSGENILYDYCKSFTLDEQKLILNILKELREFKTTEEEKVIK